MRRAMKSFRVVVGFHVFRFCFNMWRVGGRRLCRELLHGGDREPGRRIVQEKRESDVKRRNRRGDMTAPDAQKGLGRPEYAAGRAAMGRNEEKACGGMLY